MDGRTDTPSCGRYMRTHLEKNGGDKVKLEFCCRDPVFHGQFDFRAALSKITSSDLGEGHHGEGG